MPEKVPKPSLIGNTLTNADKGQKAAGTQWNRLVIVYAVFASLAVLVYQWIGEGKFSSVITLSALFELLAFVLLGVHIHTTGSVHGISAKSLTLEAIALVCRLSSTTWLLGYLPTDAAGDWLYQSVDILSLVLVVWLLYQILNAKRKTYDADNDELALGPFLAVAFILACLLHGNLDRRPIFDALYYCGLFLTSVAPVPYLWLMVRNKGPVPAFASHFVAAMALSRIMSGAYMWDAYNEISCEPYFGNFNYAGLSVISAHAVHLILLADFGYFYVKNVTTAGLKADMEFSGTWTI